MTHDVIVALAVLGVVGQAAAVTLVLVGLLALVGVDGTLRFVRELIWGYELWLVFAVAALGTAGSLFLSEVAGYIPCELCWYQRICLYPLTLLSLLAALANDYRMSRYLLPFPIVGAALAIYQILLENGVVQQTPACLASAPGGCATKWIEKFGYVTIPVLGLTGFVLATAFLLFAAAEPGEPLELEPAR